MAHEGGYRVFVDGQVGTTGLEINQRLAGHSDIEILAIPEADRKDPHARRSYLSRADVVFLCLPDDAARESVSLVTDPKVRIIDASTAHRVDPAWTYGLPEIEPGQRKRISGSRRVTVPGCHATGFILLVRPLIEAGVLPPEYPAICYSLTGYSGGGKKLIDLYRTADERGQALTGPRHYALELKHKHVPEMTAHSGLAAAPLFCPVVANYYRGMVVSVPIVTRTLGRSIGPAGFHRILSEYYAGERFVKVVSQGDAAYLDGGFLDPRGCNETNRAELSVHGNADQVLLAARLDNLGKGASGAAVQCMNLMLGMDEGTGLPA